jgi:hypothetical protein
MKKRRRLPHDGGGGNEGG